MQYRQQRFQHTLLVQFREMFLCYIQSQLAQLVSDRWNGIQGNDRTHFQAYFFQLEQH